MTGRLRHAVLLAAALLCPLTVTTAALAQDAPAQQDAGAHFGRGVQLYNEADYRAALVEFKRAYEIAPNVAVLYNIGQTYYQLQNYAEALKQFERFLAEGGTAHRSEVEQTVSVLRTRVGKIDVTTPSPGWTLTVDDEPAGTTPLASPLAVSVGRRKIIATKTGEQPIVKWVEVAAGDTLPVALTAAPAVAPVAPPPSTTPPPPPPEKKSGNGLIIAGWIGTGALFAGTVITGILATSEAGKLSDAKKQVPGNQSDIDSKASSTKTLALVTDILGASTIILGGVTLYFTLTHSSSKGEAAPTTRIGVGPSRFVLEGSF